MQYHHVTKVLLGIENSARSFFERFPFTHAFFAGVGVILFWRGIWELADKTGLDPIASILIGIVILGGIGLFIQTFVGNAIIIKSVKTDEKIERKITKEVAKEETEITKLNEKIDLLNNKIDQIIKDHS